ncbi:hypothetical protein [Protaetiibacter intestinalis]|uniref:Uncharacterized protein n=1 Tax=Protaetiibacter intestinalis TaxID=2419774 RepID=A0A387BJU2_9MICO|nr:hypothetical protein [Protaetiibacter intestinalis]AYF98800.1 hypothetical protein D7I47_11425 [Protaetiibacter intestinalis]
MRRRWVGTAAFATVALSAIGLAAGGAAHAAPPEPTVFLLEFDLLEQGVPQTRSDDFSLGREAQLTGFSWLEREGVMQDVDLRIEVCASSGVCVDPQNLAGPVTFAAGATTVTVTATLTAPPGEDPTGSVLGRLTFTADDRLGATGVDVGAAVMWAAAVLMVGFLLIALVRSRRFADRADADAP